MLVRLFSLASAPVVELAEAVVATGDERTQADCVGQCKGFT